MFIAIKMLQKNTIYLTIVLIKPFLLYQKQLNRNIGQEGIAHAQQKMLYI